MRQGLLTALGIILTTTALASRPASSLSTSTPDHDLFTHAQNMRLCRSVRSLVRGEWQHHFYAVSPAISGIMHAAMDGDTRTTRKELAAIPPEQRMRWRQTALSQAELGNQPATVRALIVDGANPNGRAWIPPYTTGAWKQAMIAMAKDARLGPLTKAMQKNGAEMNQGMWIPPPLIHAAQCDETRVMTALLESGASVSATWFAHAKGGDALLIAVLNGNAAATRLLLDHGADACHDDRLMARNAKRMHHKKVLSLADIARKNGLPADLVARLRCRAP